MTKEEKAFRAGFSLGYDRDADISKVGIMWEKYSRSKKEECRSCKNGFNGKNGNGYQPCGCK